MSGLSVLISHYGNTAIFFLMALESCCILIPSEVVLPFAGYLAYHHTLNFWTIVIVSTIANAVGSLVAYGIGLYGGRPFIRRFGKYVLLNEQHLHKAEHWFHKYGEITIFIGRLVPAVRAFVSLPAGVAKMSLWRFLLFTILGSLPWNMALTYAGLELHAHWNIVDEKLKPLTYIGALVLVLLVLWFWFSRGSRKRR